MRDGEPHAPTCNNQLEYSCSAVYLPNVIPSFASAFTQDGFIYLWGTVRKVTGEDEIPRRGSDSHSLIRPFEFASVDTGTFPISFGVRISF